MGTPAMAPWFAASGCAVNLPVLQCRLEPRPMKEQFKRTKLFHDPTPGAIVNNRIVLGMVNIAGQIQLTYEENGEFTLLLIPLARKMVSVWEHKEKYKMEEHRLVEKAKTHEPKPADADFELSQDLLREFDEFLVQLKSALDHLVKVPVPLFGKKVWNLHTFGDKGEDVLTALKNNLPRKHKPMVESFESNIFDKHRSWLQAAIGARDRVNHCMEGGLPAEAFCVAKVDGKIQVPMVTQDMSAAQMMEMFWLNLIALVEDFLALFLSFKLQSPFAIFHGSVPPDSPQSPYTVRIEADIYKEWKPTDNPT
jgi:hypothetical protein